MVFFEQIAPVIAALGTLVTIVKFVWKKTAPIRRKKKTESHLKDFLQEVEKNESR